MQTKPAFEELERRIQQDVAFFQSAMPERNVIGWHGYLAALIEWGLLSPDEHARLTAMLPVVEDNPAVAILLGREDEAKR